MAITRRALVVGVGAVGVTVVAGGAIAYEVPGVRHRIHHLIDPVPEPSYDVPAQDARIVSGSFVSGARGGRTVGWSIAYPPGDTEGLPVALVLHGRGDDHSAVFGSHAWGRYLMAAVADGLRPFAIAAADGGDHGYWHRRSDGDDAQEMLVSEFIPMLAARGLRTDKLGLAGWSMGGYGAILLAERLGESRCAVLAVDSPALWTSAGSTAPGAFDDAADYARNDVFSRRQDLAGIPTRIAIGTSDPFYSATRAFVAGMNRRPVTAYSGGGHDLAFWRHSAPGQIAFLARHLPR
jgi:S-formylglutathione hydrolase FrmB